MHLNFADRVSGATSSRSSSTSSVTSSPSAGVSSKASSLARAFTTSIKNKESQLAQMGRSSSQRTPARPVQISLPVKLISTTNMLSYDAPDLPHAPLKKQQEQQPHHQYVTSSVARKSSTSSSAATSDSSSLLSRHSDASHSTAATSLSVDGFSPQMPEENHLTCYFKQSHANSPPPPPPQSRLSGKDYTVSRADSLVSNQASSPRIPSRASTHSKKAHVLSHKRSTSRTNVNNPNASNRHETIGMFSSDYNYVAIKDSTPSSHPFGKELEQLNEIAEEFSSSVRDAEQHADLGVLQAKGLDNFRASVYVREIAPLFSSAYGDEIASAAPAWI